MAKTTSDISYEDIVSNMKVAKASDFIDDINDDDDDNNDEILNEEAKVDKKKRKKAKKEAKVSDEESTSVEYKEAKPSKKETQHNECASEVARGTEHLQFSKVSKATKTDLIKTLKRGYSTATTKEEKQRIARELSALGYDINEIGNEISIRLNNIIKDM